MKLHSLIALIFFSLAVLTVSAQEGTVASCNNTEKTPAARKCDCERTDNKDCDKPLADGDDRDKPGARCKTYCRPDACDCHDMCYMPT